MLRLDAQLPSHMSGPCGGLCLQFRAVYNPSRAVADGLDLDLLGDPSVIFVGAAHVGITVLPPLEAPAHREPRSYFVDHAESRSSIVDESVLHGLSQGTELSDLCWEYTLNGWMEVPAQLWHWRDVERLDGCGLGTSTRSALEGHYARCCAAGGVNLGRALAVGRDANELGLLRPSTRLESQLENSCAALIELLTCLAVCVAASLRQQLSDQSETGADGLAAGLTATNNQRCARLAAGRLELLVAGLRTRYPRWEPDLPLTARHYLSALRAIGIGRDALAIDLPLLSGPLMGAADPPDGAYSWRSGGVVVAINSVFSLLVTYNGGGLNILDD
ncbi:hypothetical protein T492DRAFT_848428 [Pavlovales sp. CCMP2436]|nr:hypothetical protein T492DRAFT_848428 [Pavlovales sp. CCMP2436]